MHIRALAPAFIKKWIWDRRPKNEGRPEFCPVDFRKLLGSRLGPHDTLLDFGCGTGSLLLALRKDGWKGHYIGVDVSSKSIALARKIGDENAEWFSGLIEDFPTLPEVTVVSFVESLYYVNDVPRLLRRWKQADIYARIGHEKRHSDVIAQLKGFHQDGPLWYRLHGTAAEDSETGKPVRLYSFY
jgi:SAM-dependent methyltransferase